MSTANGTDEQPQTTDPDEEMAHANGQVNGQLNGHVEGVGEIRAVNINHEMQTAYLDYAMSVIVARALLDVRDGLTPVRRRIL